MELWGPLKKAFGFNWGVLGPKLTDVRAHHETLEMQVFPLGIRNFHEKNFGAMMTETSSCSELEKPTKNRGDDRGFELPPKIPQKWFQRAKQVQDQVIPDYIYYCLWGYHHSSIRS